MAGKRADTVEFAEAFRVEVRDGVAQLPGVVSRKKQVIPAQSGATKQLAEEE